MQHPEQGLSSQNPSADIEAMKKAHNSAISSNEKIFPIFAKKLASKDTKEFLNTARKLALWLGSEKAYYPAARPKIVELLEIALSAFSETFIHHSTISEFAERVRQLIQAVIPFKDLFENELKPRLQRVISDTSLFLSSITSAANAAAQVEGSVTANISSPTPASPVQHSQPTIPPVPVPQMSISWRIQTALSTPNVEKGPGSGGTVQTDSTPQAPQVASSGQIEAVLSPASPVTSTLQHTGGHISPTIPSKPQPKRARRAELSEELIARDLDWFKSTQSSAIVNQGPTAHASKAGEPSPAVVSDAPHIPTQSPSPKKKTARMVPSRLPRRISTQGVESGISTSTLPPAAPPSSGPYENAQGVSIQMDVDEQKPSLERTESGARAAAVPEARNVQEVSRGEELLSPEPRLVAVSSNEPSNEPQIPRADYQSPLVEYPLTSETPISARPSVPLPEAMSDRMVSMDISNSDSGTERPPSEYPTKPEVTPPGSPQMLTLQLRSPILPLLVNALEPPLNLDFRIPQTSPGQLWQSEIDANKRRFDDEMTVICSTQGKPFTHTHAIDISLSESIFSKISKWVHRKSRPSDASQGVCISLACYRLLECFDTIKSENDKPGIEALLRSSCSWPSSNRLSLHVKDGERRTTITLSPPLFLTPDQCVDVSSLMQPGDNTLEIRQKDDLSEYLVVLHAHRPTRAQLAELDAIKATDERWKLFLDVISARVVPEKMLDDAHGCVVEVS